MAIDCEVQRLQLGDVVLIDLPDQPAKVEGKVVRPIERTESAVLASLRVAGQDDFVREWMLDERWLQLSAVPRDVGEPLGAKRVRRRPAAGRPAEGELCSAAPR